MVLLGSLFLAGIALAGVSAVDPPAASAAGGGSVAKCGGGKIFLSADERQSFYLHNRERAKRKLKPLCVHPSLQTAARAHSKDMIKRDYFSHTTKGTSRDGCDRVKRRGYRFRNCGENIALGSGSKGGPGAIMRSWMNSSGHRKNILSNKYREVGIGVSKGTYKGYGGVRMYTADFGTRR